MGRLTIPGVGRLTIPGVGRLTIPGVGRLTIRQAGRARTAISDLISPTSRSVRIRECGK